MEQIALPLVLAAAAACLIVWLLFHRLVIVYLYALNIPTAQPAYPIIGHLTLLFRKEAQEMFNSIVQLFNGVDRIAKLHMVTVPVVLVNHPDLLQELLNRTEFNDKPFLYRYMGLGNGLLTERCGSSWRCNRKLLSPSFNIKVLSEFIPTMDAIGRKMVNRLETLTNKEAELDVSSQMSQCALEMVYSTTLGCKMEEREGQQEYIRRLEAIISGVGERAHNFDKYLGPVYRLSKKSNKDTENRIFCNNFTKTIVEERKKEMTEDINFFDRLNSDDGIHMDKRNFLNHILVITRLGIKKYSNKELLHHINTIVAAGYETSALTTTQACLNLALEPEIQSKVVAEIKQVFHSPTVEVTHETLKQLVYLDMVIKETLRLHPPIPFVLRRTATAVELDSIRIPKDQIFVFSFYNLHRRRDIWGDDVERFDPERFRPELAKKRHPYAFLPFSGGYRNCIGARYAMNAVKIMLLRILQNFELSTRLQRQDLRFRLAISLRLIGPYAIRLKKRDLYRET